MPMCDALGAYGCHTVGPGIRDFGNLDVETLVVRTPFLAVCYGFELVVHDFTALSILDIA